MDYLFSETTGGFYVEGVHATEDIPSDVRHVTAEERQEILAHTRGGNTSFVPPRVTMYQARAALLHAGHLEAVEAALAAMPEGMEAKQARLAWEYAQSVERASPFTTMLAAALGLSDAEVDDLFIAAGQVQ